ncbi:hypothetical protein B9Z55_023283 [Caenorhabditis nigoni]|uniref:Uncharacterized protein n=1 Tax=Caenorhabditis nigoni TaxID=1611254 RepID=A0A2G5SPQ5_9PELO|nr:hypothetical protein B9Z55_023283 [Caenorhabditis nigoni]
MEAVVRSLMEKVAEQESWEEEPTDDLQEDYEDPFDEKKLDPALREYVKKEKSIAFEAFKTAKAGAIASMNEFVELLFKHNNSTYNFEKLSDTYEDLLKQAKNVSMRSAVDKIKKLNVSLMMLDNAIQRSMYEFQELVANGAIEEDSDEEKEEEDEDENAEEGEEVVE